MAAGPVGDLGPALGSDSTFAAEGGDPAPLSVAAEGGDPVPLSVAAEGGDPAPLTFAAEGGEPMPLAVSWGLAILLLGTAALLAWVGVRSASGRLARNGLVGVRTARTMASDRAWAAAHRAAAPWLVGGAVAITVPGLVLLARPSNALGSMVVLAGCGLLVALVAVGSLLGQRAAEDAEHTG